MNFKTEITQTVEGKFLWHQERSILEATEMICSLMKSQKVSRAELARRLQKSKGYITQLLDGATNMTLRTVSDVFVALGKEFHPSASPLEGQPTMTISFDVVDLRKVNSISIPVTHDCISLNA